MKTRPGLSLRSRRAETRSVPWLDAMDYHRSSCLAGDVNCEIPRLNVPRLTGCNLCRQLWLRDRLLFRKRGPRCKAEASAGTIEVEINGVTDAKTLMAVLRALKGQRGSWVGARFRAST